MFALIMIGSVIVGAYLQWERHVQMKSIRDNPEHADKLMRAYKMDDEWITNLFKRKK
jgi:hypothetical protein